MKRLKKSNNSEFIENKLNEFEKFYFNTISNLTSAIESLSYAYDKAYGSKSHNDIHWEYVNNLEKARELLRETYHNLNKN